MCVTQEQDNAQYLLQVSMNIIVPIHQWLLLLLKVTKPAFSKISFAFFGLELK